MLKLISLNDPILRQIAKDVDDFSDINSLALNILAHSMYETMIAYDGVGLAAPQVGHSVKLFITRKFQDIDSLMDNAKKPLPFNMFINPEIKKQSLNFEIGEEGCLSIPNQLIQVPRPQSILFEADDLSGSRYARSLNGIWARIFCHEYDHLFGKLIIDYI